MTTKQRAILYHELSKLLSAGMHIDRSVELLLEQRPAASVRDYLKGLQKGLEERLSFAQAVATHNAHLVTKLEVSLLTAGERGGRLESSCEHLARYFELRQKSTDKAVGAIIYPLIILHLGLMFPDLSSVMQGGGFENILPQALRRLAIAWAVLGSLGAGAVVLLKMATKSSLIDRVLSMVPLVGAARRHWALARFCQVFQTCLLAALNMAESLRLAGGATQSAVLDTASQRAADRVQQGDALAPSMRKTGDFPRTFLNAVDTAEQTGTLDTEMGRWAVAEAEMGFRAQDRAAEWLPRIFYVIVVLYIGSRIVRMFAAYYGQVNQMMEAL
jgi:type II secretory pathway component PulF